MRLMDTLRFKRDLVKQTTTYQDVYAAMIASQFTEGITKGAALNDLEKASVHNTVYRLGIPSLASADLFYLGNDVMREYKDRSLGPDPQQLGSVYPYTRNGLLCFETPVNINPSAILQRQSPIEANDDTPAADIIPITAISWAVGDVPVYTAQGEMTAKPGVVIIAWTSSRDIRDAFMASGGSDPGDAYYKVYPLTYSSAAYGGWFIPETGVDTELYDTTAQSYMYDGDQPSTAAPATLVCMVHTFWKMLEEEIFISTHQPASSKYLKMMRRGNMHDNGVSVITLRHANYIGEYDHEGRLIDWKWRWEVRGHYRRIRDRVTGEERLVWVRAYLKGPDGKPIRYTEKINALTR